MLKNLLERFDPKLHAGEVMDWRPLGVEVWCWRRRVFDPYADADADIGLTHPVTS